MVARDETAKSIAPNTEAFKAFQADLKADAEALPEVEQWAVAGATYDLG